MNINNQQTVTHNLVRKHSFSMRDYYVCPHWEIAVLAAVNYCYSIIHILINYSDQIILYYITPCNMQAGIVHSEFEAFILAH